MRGSGGEGGQMRCVMKHLVLLLLASTARGEYVRVFRVEEGVPPGTRIGFIGEAEVRGGLGVGVWSRFTLLTWV